MLIVYMVEMLQIDSCYRYHTDYWLFFGGEGTVAFSVLKLD